MDQLATRELDMTRLALVNCRLYDSANYLGTMRIALTSAIFLLALVGCGMSREDKESYADEIKSAGESVDIYQKTSERMIEIDREGQRLGMGVDPDGSTRKSIEKTGAYIEYRSCLKRYEKSGEKFATAKTACTIESGLNNY